MHKWSDQSLLLLCCSQELWEQIQYSPWCFRYRMKHEKQFTLTWDTFKKKKLVQFSERGIKILKTVFVRVMWVTTKLFSILSIFLVASFLVANTIQTCVCDSSCLFVRGSNTLGEMPLGIFDGISVYPAQHNSIKWDPRLPKNKLSPSMHLCSDSWLDTICPAASCSCPKPSWPWLSDILSSNKKETNTSVMQQTFK